MDPSALQIEKEQVKTVQFNPDEDVIPFSDHEGASGSLSGSGDTGEGDAEGGSDASEGAGGRETNSLQTSVEGERSGMEEGPSPRKEGACGASYGSDTPGVYMVWFGCGGHLYICISLVQLCLRPLLCVSVADVVVLLTLWCC